MVQLAFLADWWNEQTFTLQIFWGVGLLAVFLIILQAFFGFFLGHDGDASTDVDTDADVDASGGHGTSGYFSLKTISALLLGFGLGGAMLIQRGFHPSIAAAGGLLLGGIISGSYLVLMRSLYSLRSDGTAVLSEAIGRIGTVYLRVPGSQSGAGEVQVSFGGRMQNVKAFTSGPALPTGTDVRVMALRGENALMVEKV